VTSLVVAVGAVEVRAHRVAGAVPGTPVRVTGWPDPKAELLPVAALSEDLTGVVAEETGTLFVALARLTREADPLPLTERVIVRVRGQEELSVHWAGGRRADFTFTAPDGRAAGSSWSVTPR